MCKLGFNVPYFVLLNYRTHLSFVSNESFISYIYTDSAECCCTILFAAKRIIREVLNCVCFWPLYYFALQLCLFVSYKNSLCRLKSVYCLTTMCHLFYLTTKKGTKYFTLLSHQNPS